MIVPVGPLAVPTPGTPVRATKGESNPAKNYACHGYLFQVFPGNTGNVYIGEANMNKSTLVGVLAVLPVPTANTLPTFSAALTISPNALQLQSVYVDADVAGDGVLCTVLIM